jgi:DNA-binding GntR family transcriptional regulator
LTDQVYEAIHGWIVNGELPAGHRLRVRDLAERVGTSVMPVREAIRRLTEAGLVVHEPYKGASVRGLDLVELDHAYDVRILLEAEAARLGAEAADQRAIDHMQRHWSQLELAARRGDFTEALAQDEQLLERLYACSGNEIMQGVIRGLWHRCRPYRLLWARAAMTTEGTHLWRYKPALITAAVAKDGRAAETVIRESYGAAKQALAAMVSAQTL